VTADAQDALRIIRAFDVWLDVQGARACIDPAELGTVRRGLDVILAMPMQSPGDMAIRWEETGRLMFPLVRGIPVWPPRESGLGWPV